MCGSGPPSPLPHLNERYNDTPPEDRDFSTELKVT
jgi:hypothetical protein